MVTAPPAQLPGLVRAYTGLVTEAVTQTLGSDLMGVAVTGSLALGDFIPKFSDIDLIAVTSQPLSQYALRDLPARIDDDVLPCPAVSLDLLVFTSEQVLALPSPYAFELAITTGDRWGLEVVPRASDEEMLLDVEISRRQGFSVTGLPPEELFAPVPPQRLRTALLAALTWQREHLFDQRHDPRGTEGVLAACRALYWLETGELASKTEAGRRQARAPGHGPLVGEALARRGGRIVTALRGSKVRGILDLAMRELKNG
jgi:hypothetical protein